MHSRHRVWIIEGGHYKGDLFEFVSNERTKCAELNGTLMFFRAPCKLALELLAHKEYLSLSLMLVSHRRLYRVTASHGHLVLFHAGDGD